MNNIFQKFSTHSKNALKNAFGLALASGHKIVTPQHILYGLSQETGSIAGQILHKAKIDGNFIKSALNNSFTAKQTLTHIALDSDTKKVLERSFLIAATNQHKYIGTEHLLAALIHQNESIINILKTKGVNLAEIQTQVTTILNSTAKFTDFTNSFDYFKDNGAKNEAYTQTNTTSQTDKSMLELFATDLTNQTVQKRIDPVIGRQEEINRLIQILSRRNKNNPLLLGDPGVGKTAIVEGLAKKIILHDVPPVLLNKKIYALDLSLVVAGTSFRGEFENRLKQIISAVKKDPDILLFIDEIHNIIGVGSATGSMDAANILKPALARGEIRCIGATTPQDYKKFIESDPALERRFQPINIEQPSVEKTIEILKGIKENYENFHQVVITDEAITAAAQLSERYIADRFLPDKAIDLIDEAASAVKIKNLSVPVNQELISLENQLQETTLRKEEAVAKEKFNFAIKHRLKEKDLLAQILALKQKQENQAPQKLIAEITKKDIAQIISKVTGIPIADLILEEKNQLLKLEKTLGGRIIGQPEAIKSIAEFIRRSRTGISNANRPIGSFIFLGPSGVGKTESAKVLAEAVFGSPQALVKIDMSEFAEAFNISKLIGAPAGYIGYKDGTKLTDSVKRRPYSVVLFDEIEKAHLQIYNLLLQILEDGGLTDGTGKMINFKNTIIIMTSNLGSESFNRQVSLGFGTKKGNDKELIERSFEEIKDEVIKKLKEKFPPEFLSRVDKVVVFQPLTNDAINKIVVLQLEELKNRLAKKNISFEFDPAVAEFIAKISYSPTVGARAIRKNIQDLIESKIANKILTTKGKLNKKISIKVKDNQIII
jgi:ATP-dependent Clp protease ATP-binding subunit ClpC